MYNRKKSDSPANANQIYVDGKRYRSISAAAADTEITFCHIVNKLTESAGGPIRIKEHSLVSEKWLLSNPDKLIEIMKRKRKNDEARTPDGCNPIAAPNTERRN